MLSFLSFRYSGKTQKQMQEYVRENFVKRQSFQRYGYTAWLTLFPWKIFYLKCSFQST